MSGKHIVCDRYAYSGVAFSSGAYNDICFYDVVAEAEPCKEGRMGQIRYILRPTSQNSFCCVTLFAAKPGLDLAWCKTCDTGLPMPDSVLFMELSVDDAAKRGGFGGERLVWFRTVAWP